MDEFHDSFRLLLLLLLLFLKPDIIRHHADVNDLSHLEFVVNLNQLLQFRGAFFRLDEARAETPVSTLSYHHSIRLSGYQINRL